MPPEQKNWVVDSHLSAESIHIGDNYFVRPQNWPVGIWQLQDPTPHAPPASQLSFRSFLHRRVLPYYARSEFQSAFPEAREMLSEDELLQQLLDTGGERYYRGCVLYGEGGIGKTRMMLELGHRAREAGWQVLLVRRETRHLTALNEYLDTEQRYLLLFDYLELSQGFYPDLHQQLRKLPEQSIKLLANCRYTFRQNVRFPESDHFLQIDLSRGHWQQAYQKWVVKKILETAAVATPPPTTIFHLKPAFAVFMRYLADHQGIDKVKMLRSGDFRTWFRTRLALTLDPDPTAGIPLEVIQLMVCLPLTSEQIDRLPEEYQKFVERLGQDGWIESLEGGRHRALHDTLVDELLLIFLESYLVSSSMKRLLDFANEVGSLKAFLRSIERIFSLLDDEQQQIFRRLLAKEVLLLDTLGPELAVSPIFSEVQRMKFFNKHFRVFRAYLLSEEFALPLSYAAHQLQRQAGHGRAALRFLFRHWLQAHPDFQSRLPARSETAILSAVLHLNEPVQYQHYLSHYEHPNGLSAYTSYVITAWLSAGGQALVIRPILQAYLDRFGTHPNAQFVYKAWLDRDQDYQILWLSFQGFLQKYGADTAAFYPLQAWLGGSHPPDLIQEPVVNYIQRNTDQLDTHHLLVKWLDRGGDPEAIAGCVSAFLDRHALQQAAQFVIRKWLRYGGDPLRVQPYLLQHLEHDPLLPGVRFLYSEWLKSSGSATLILPYLQQYLQQPLTKEVGFVIQAWLEHQSDYDFIRPSLHRYLKKFPNNEALLVAALERREDDPIVRNALINRLQTNAGTPEIGWLLQWSLGHPHLWPELVPPLNTFLTQVTERKSVLAILREVMEQKMPLPQLGEHILRYVSSYPDEISSAWLLRSYIEQSGTEAIPMSNLHTYFTAHPGLLYHHLVINAWLRAVGPAAESLQNHISAWLDLHLNNPEAKAVYLLQNWLEYAGPADFIRPYLKQWLSSCADHPEATYLKRHWLAAGGSEATLRSWLAGIEEE